MKLSIIIPAYNEEATIGEILRRVRAAETFGLSKEIIVIDDGSQDGTAAQVAHEKDVVLIKQSPNQGKGVAIIAGLKDASGDIMLVQDADLEYDPDDYPALLKPILDDRADVVYGSRFIGDRPRRVLFFHHYLANKLITFFSNLFTNLNLSDIETGYKVFRKVVINTILPRLESRRFGIEVELTARVAKSRWRVYEVGISYSSRTYGEGKKITWKDGLAAIWHIFRFNLFD